MHSPSGFYRPILFLLPIFFFFLAPEMSGQVSQEGVVVLSLDSEQSETNAGTTISPTVLYPGENVITVSAMGGIRSVYLQSEGNAPVEGYGAEIEKECATSATLRIRVNTASIPVNPAILVQPCDDSPPARISLRLNTVWNLDEVSFPDVEPGEEICRPFQIRLDGIAFGNVETILDSVSSHDPRVSFAFSSPPPVAIPRGTTYQYSVCFRADEPGVYRFPVITWIRRDQPAGGYTTYPVADTGVIRVVKVEEEIITEELELSSQKIESEINPVTIDPSGVDSVVLRSIDSIGTEENPGLTLSRVPTPPGPTPTPATLIVKTAALERGRD